MTASPDTTAQRRHLAGTLRAAGDLSGPAMRAAVEAVPRELFLHPGIFLPDDLGLWHPRTPETTDPTDWIALAYRNKSLVTQLDGRITADQVTTPTRGFPTSSSTVPGTVVSMIEELELDDDHTVLEIGTGTGYSTALLCHQLGEDKVTTVEVDADVAARADAALENAGYSTWPLTGDGLVGHPHRAPYDRVIATCAVHRIPYAWVRQTAPGGIVLATVGHWSYGTGLARLVVRPDGTAHGRITGRASFMPARSQAAPPLSGDLAARAHYADSRRTTVLDPAALEEWTPAFLAQLATLGAQLTRSRTSDGNETVYLFDPARESFTTLIPHAAGWSVRQGGPVALWDAVEEALTAWESAGQPDISTIRLTVTQQAHHYAMGRQPALNWTHPVV